MVRHLPASLVEEPVLPWWRRQPMQCGKQAYSLQRRGACICQPAQ